MVWSFPGVQKEGAYKRGPLLSTAPGPAGVQGGCERGTGFVQCSGNWAGDPGPRGEVRSEQHPNARPLESGSVDSVRAAHPPEAGRESAGTGRRGAHGLGHRHTELQTPNLSL